VALKLGHTKLLIEDIIIRNNVNHQDDLCNTILFYAIKINDRYTINLLHYYHTDPNIKINKKYYQWIYQRK